MPSSEERLDGIVRETKQKADLMVADLAHENTEHSRRLDKDLDTEVIGSYVLTDPGTTL